MRIPLILVLLSGCIYSTHASNTNERLLHTSLKFNGPIVHVRAPLGFRYRPGYAIPVQITVSNDGSQPNFNADITILEGLSGADEIRTTLVRNMTVDNNTRQTPYVPVRAPDGAANLTLLIRESGAGEETRSLRFQASLQDIFKPLDTNARLILAYGKIPPRDVIYMTPKEFPDETWMYESADLVVLGDDSFNKDASPNAKQALRKWLLGGGRVLLASQIALRAGIDCGLLPIAPGTNYGSGVKWWEQNAGLKDADIVKSKEHHNIYGQLRMGLGRVAFLFPGACLEDAQSNYGLELFESMALKRINSIDFRVQAGRLGAFACDTSNAGRRTTCMLWMVAGAVMFCLALALSLTSRSRWEVAGLPFAVTALLSVLLANWFPPPNLVVSRVQWARRSADGRAVTWNEWTLLKSFQYHVPAVISGPPEESLTQVWESPDDLQKAQCGITQLDGIVRINVDVWPDLPAILFATHVSEDGPPGAAMTRPILRDTTGKKQVLLPPSFTRSFHLSHAILICADKSVWHIRNLKIADESFQLSKEPEAIANALLCDGQLKTTPATQAHETILNSIAEEIKLSDQDTLVYWEDKSDTSESALTSIQNLSAETTTKFVIYSAEVTVIDDSRLR